MFRYIPFFLFVIVVGLSSTRIVHPVNAWIQQGQQSSSATTSLKHNDNSNNAPWISTSIHAPPPPAAPRQQWFVQHGHHRRGMTIMMTLSNHPPAVGGCSSRGAGGEQRPRQQRDDDDNMPTNSRSIVPNNNNNNDDSGKSCPSPSPATWNNNNNYNSRRQWLLQQLQVVPLTVAAAASAAAVLFVDSHPANALVKGVAPPPSKSSSSDRPKCTNVEECQAIAAQKEQQEREVQEANQRPVLVTSRGTRYRDIILDPTTTTTTTTPSASGGAVVQNGDTVTVYYKVLKLGKRSYDGLSGEGTVIFSRGYGYEDDEVIAGPRIQSWTTTVGDVHNIDAFNDAIVGCTVGTIRRIVVLPQNGWRKPGQYCDGGPGGSGTGGELRTDYIVVPTATMVATESCFDTTKQPFPQTYGPQRRMAQRFDQSLILEVEVVDINKRG